VHCEYHCKDSDNNPGIIRESFSSNSEKSRHVLYGQLIRKHCENPSSWYIHLDKRHKVEEMLQSINSPTRLVIVPDENTYKIKRKYFD
jgi:hypothetical protein